MSCLINDSKLLHPRLSISIKCLFRFNAHWNVKHCIGLPTLDIYSDLALSTKLLINRRAIWATSILVPFLVNYVLGWRAWIEEEKRIFVLLDVDGQDHLVRLEAARRRGEAKDTLREERQI